MKIAVLYWPTSSVGGINTSLQTLRATALGRGATFHIFNSAAQKTKTPQLFASRKSVRGGDTNIIIDGEAPHHPSNYLASAAFLSRYDVILLSTISPHPTKSYGDEPLFMALLEKLHAMGKPIIGYVRDAYFETYKEFAELALPLMCRTLCSQAAYGEPLVKAGYPITPVYIPYLPQKHDPQVKKESKLVAWMPQWKNIKGVHQFFDGVPRATASGLTVEMYSNGIEYYKMRLLPSWKESVGADYFAPAYSGTGAARFFGCKTLPEVHRVMARAEFMLDFQGHAAKWPAYKNGSYNNTVIEALYYGAMPVVHSNMLKSAIPSDLLLALDDVKLWPEAVLQFDHGKYDQARARDFVIEHHSAEKLYDIIFDSCG